MVGQEVLVRGKHKGLKKFLKVFFIILVALIILGIIFMIGYFIKKPVANMVTLEHPMKDLVFANTNEVGEVNREAVVEQALLEFDVDYINYLMTALGVHKLKKSLIGYGNPQVELDIDGEIWSTEVVDGGLNTKNEAIGEEDIRVVLSKREAVEGLLSSDLQSFMIESVQGGRTGIEMVAGKAELLSKGYLGMYKDLTGEDVVVE